MTPWEDLYPYLPERMVSAMKGLTYTQWRDVREIRLRQEEPLVFVTACGVRYLGPMGLTALRQTGVLRCGRQELAACVARLCQESVYAYQEQLRQGFLSLAGGIRVGVTGRAMLRGTVVGVEDITGLCIRLPGRHRGCGIHLLPYIADESGLHSTLLVGEPCSGKTTLLRDVAAGMAAQGYRVTVVDERGELAGVDGLAGCDVLTGYPKAMGTLQAVRCLSPQVVVFDELGDVEEVEAVTACANAGVAVVASLHGRTPWEAEHRPAARMLVRGGVFERWLFLVGRDHPGQVAEGLCPEVTDGEIRWTVAHCSGRSGAGLIRFPSPDPTGATVTAVGAGDGKPVASADLWGTPNGRDVATVGGK